MQYVTQQVHFMSLFHNVSVFNGLNTLYSELIVYTLNVLNTALYVWLNLANNLKCFEWSGKLQNKGSNRV